jgi:thiazole synthase
MIEQAEVPLIVDAGLGAPSQAAESMELGADGVLVNTAIGLADDPVEMARAFKLAVEAGRAARLAGLIEESETARPSSPITGVITR